MKQIAAIPYENGQVFGHYGKTQAFLIATIEDGNIMNHDVVPTQGKGHGELAGFLKADAYTHLDVYKRQVSVRALSKAHRCRQPSGSFSAVS